jgi:hypothetical protein
MAWEPEELPLHQVREISLMNETDDRLAGDLVWELFASPTPRPPQEGTRIRQLGRWLVVAGLVALGLCFFPPLAVTAACLSAGVPDYRKGRKLAQSIPSKAAGTICARFTYAWGAFKIGFAAFLLMFVSIAAFAAAGRRDQLPTAFIAAVLLWIGGFMVSAALTVSALLAAYRSGMRVWIGDGTSEA